MRCRAKPPPRIPSSVARPDEDLSSASTSILRDLAWFGHRPWRVENATRRRGPDLAEAAGTDQPVIPAGYLRRHRAGIVLWDGSAAAAAVRSGAAGCNASQPAEASARRARLECGTATRGDRDDHPLHPLYARRQQARRLRGLCEGPAVRDRALRRPAPGLLPADQIGRRNQYWVGADRFSEPCRL